MWVCFGWRDALNGQSYSFDGDDLFWWRMQPEWKCLGGVRGDLKQKPLTPFWSSHSHSSCCLSLCLPLSSSSIFFLPPLRLDPWLWLWAQQPCNPPLPCSKGLSYLRTEASMQAFIWKEKKSFIHPCVRVCLCARACVCAWQTTKLCTNSEWWLTSCSSLWRWESVHFTHFREKLSLPDLHKSPCDMTDKFRQKNSKNKGGARWTCAPNITLRNKEKTNPFRSLHNGLESLLFLSSQTSSSLVQ